ncbi:hypothetical protein U3516DRAFT_751797 [Neocallimastix sp. 'constans']
MYHLVPNNGIIITDGAFYLYFCKILFLLIAIENTVDLRFDVDIINDIPFNKQDKWTSNSLNTFNRNLLDIGFGNGGDIHKWKQFRKNCMKEFKKSDIKNSKMLMEKYLLFFLWIIAYFNGDIDSPCIKYRQRIDTHKNKFFRFIKTKNHRFIYFGNLRYVHKECDNIMFCKC